MKKLKTPNQILIEELNAWMSVNDRTESDLVEFCRERPEDVVKCIIIPAMERYALQYIEICNEKITDVHLNVAMIKNSLGSKIIV